MHHVAIDLGGAVAPGRLHRGQGGVPAVPAVEGDEGGDVDVGHAVAVGHAEWLVGIEVGGDALEAAAGECVLAGVDDRDTPGLGGAAMVFDGAVGEVYGDVGAAHGVVEEILLDDEAFVAGADDEMTAAVMGVHLHDVPENGQAADFDHWLGAQVALLGDAGTIPSGQNDDLFHPVTSKSCSRGGPSSAVPVEKPARRPRCWTSRRRAGRRNPAEGWGLRSQRRDFPWLG